MAAKELSAAGLKVQVLEARNRIGGRIHTIAQPLSNGVEAGAEFIHGNLPTTLQFLEEAGIQKLPLQGEVYQVTGGEWKQENDFFKNAELVVSKLKELQQDQSIATFLTEHFGEEKYAGLRQSLTSYIEGYYSGEPTKVSALSFLEEWMSEDEQQYRPTDSYGKMIDYLADTCKRSGAIIQLSTVVKEVRWQKGQVEVFDTLHRSYITHKVVVTVPLGVWSAEENAAGAINYNPAIPAKTEAAKQMGFGAAIKVLLDFKDAFWEAAEVSEQTGVNVSDFHMVLTDMPITTWWTQLPRRSTLLTGWLSGPKAEAMKNEDDRFVVQKALESLAVIFNVEIQILREKLQWSKVCNWTTDSFTRGSYSYSTLQTDAARKTLLEPVENTLFFAGEALYEGPEMGTVEAALTSGRSVASKILA